MFIINLWVRSFSRKYFMDIETVILPSILYHHLRSKNRYPLLKSLMIAHHFSTFELIILTSIDFYILYIDTCDSM